MPSPVAHSLVGVGGFLIAAPNVTSFEDLIHKGQTRLLFFLFLPNLPDFDMIVGLRVQGNVHACHTQFSHSLLAAFLMASGFAFICPLNNFKKRYLTIVLMIIFHDLIDSFASSDLSHPGIGMQLLNPWKKHSAAPIPLF